MQHRAVIFDLGGVILDSPLHAIARFEREFDIDVGACLMTSATTAAWWPGEGNGDDWIGESHGTVGAKTYFVPGIKGDAFHFIEDAQSYVIVPNTPAVQVPETDPQFTIEAWVRPDFNVLGNKLDTILGKRDGCGGNFTYIEAKVDRTEAELSRAGAFFGVVAPDVELYTGLKQTRRLFGQPEWIVNADLSFNHPEWGTTATLAVFAISDVLTAAGSASLGPNGVPVSMTLDRYQDEFYQLDFIASQRIWGGLSAKMSVKNLTNSKRRIVYDQEQTNTKVTERSWKKGREWSFALVYSYEF